MQEDFRPLTVIMAVVLTALSTPSGLIHSLRYVYTATCGTNGSYDFSAIGLLDGVPFIRYNSSQETATPIVTWLNESSSYYQDEGKEFKSKKKLFKMSMNNLRNYTKNTQNTTMIHTLQFTYGCEKDRSGSKSGFWKYGYDGKDYLILRHNDTQYRAAVETANKTVEKWQKDNKLNTDKNYLNNICQTWLSTYLQRAGKEFNETKSPNITMKTQYSQEGNITLKCSAFGFYPKGISITWTCDNNVTLNSTKMVDTRPSGDGTYQKWASLTLSPEEHKNYSCHVRHENITQSVTFTRTSYILSQSQTSTDQTVFVIFPLMLTTAAVMIAIKFIYKRFYVRS